MRMPDQATDQASDAHKLHACQVASTNDDVAEVWLVKSQAASRGMTSTLRMQLHVAAGLRLLRRLEANPLLIETY